jgi:hypothetical protein
MHGLHYGWFRSAVLSMPVERGVFLQRSFCFLHGLVDPIHGRTTRSDFIPAIVKGGSGNPAMTAADAVSISDGMTSIMIRADPESFVWYRSRLDRFALSPSGQPNRSPKPKKKTTSHGESVTR